MHFLKSTYSFVICFPLEVDVLEGFVESDRSVQYKKLRYFLVIECWEERFLDWPRILGQSQYPPCRYCLNSTLKHVHLAKYNQATIAALVIQNKWHISHIQMLVVVIDLLRAFSRLYGILRQGDEVWIWCRQSFYSFQDYLTLERNTRQKTEERIRWFQG